MKKNILLLIIGILISWFGIEGGMEWYRLLSCFIGGCLIGITLSEIIKMKNE